MSPLTRKESLNTWKIKRRNKRRGCGKVKERSAHVLKYCYYYDSRDILRENVIFIWKKILEIVGILLLYSLDIFNFRTLRKYFYNSLKKKKKNFINLIFFRIHSLSTKIRCFHQFSIASWIIKFQPTQIQNFPSHKNTIIINLINLHLQKFLLILFPDLNHKNTFPLVNFQPHLTHLRI